MAATSRNFRRRIAMISDHASPLALAGSVDSGGQNVYVSQVARHLARHGYQVDVFTRKDDPSLPEILPWKDGVRVIHVPAGPAGFIRKEELLPHMKEFARFMRGFIRRQDKPYDVLHAHFWMSALVAADLKRELGIPYAITFHALGRVRRKYQGEADRFPDERFAVEERTIAEADAVVAECPQDAQDLRDLYGADASRLKIIPCGFDPMELWPMDKVLARRILGLPQDEQIVLQLGRMVPRKGVDNALRGFARLVRAHGIRAQMLIVGGGSEKPDPQLTPEIGRLQEIAREQGVADQVTFVGRRGRMAIKYFYSAADVFVSTPWYEPFGITPVEAMACGTPVIGSNVGGIKYTVQHDRTGFLVPPNDPDQLAERLAELCRNPARLRRFGRQAISRVNALFTWQRVADSIAGLYEKVLTGTGEPHFREPSALLLPPRGYLMQPVWRPDDAAPQKGEVVVCRRGAMSPAKTERSE